MQTKLKIKSMVITGAVVLFGASAIGTSEPAEAATQNVTPPQSLLNKSNKYYRDNYQTIAKQYRIGRSMQTGIAKNKTVKIYLKTKNGDLRNSLYFAVQYWNQKLGRRVFQYGTQANHTVTFTTVNNAKNSEGDAWWDQNSQQVVINLRMYKNSLATLTQQIIDNSVKQGVSGAALAAEQQEIAANDLGQASRTMYYGATLTHELGHVLGLNHSPNPNDTMYYESDSPQVHDYQSLKNGTNAGFNPLTNTDVLRAKLALKVFGAFE